MDFHTGLNITPENLISLHLKYLEPLPTKMHPSGIELLRDSNGQKQLALKPSANE